MDITPQSERSEAKWASGVMSKRVRWRASEANRRRRSPVGERAPF